MLNALERWWGSVVNHLQAAAKWFESSNANYWAVLGALATVLGAFTPFLLAQWRSSKLWLKRAYSSALRDTRKQRGPGSAEEDDRIRQAARQRLREEGFFDRVIWPRHIRPQQVWDEFRRPLETGGVEPARLDEFLCTYFQFLLDRLSSNERYEERQKDLAAFLGRREAARLAEAGTVVAAPQVAAVASHKEDWQEKLDVSRFLNRVEEVEQITGAMRSVRLVVLAGRGGIGKSALLAKAGQQVAPDFERVLWRSLRTARSLEELLTSCLRFLDQDSTTLPAEKAGLQKAFIEQLERRRCLLLLDNLETVMAGGASSGQFRQGYEDFEELFRAIGSATHTSCVALTTREMPEDLHSLTGAGLPVKIHRLGGLDSRAARQLLEARGVRGADEEIARLTEQYGGNPMEMQLAVKPILDVYRGNIAEFLKDGELILGKAKSSLAWHFDRTSGLEQDVLYWLAISQEPLAWAEIRDQLESFPKARRSLREALESLRDRSLLESAEGRFWLQNVIAEYVIQRLVMIAAAEIRTAETKVLNSHPLLMASATDPVRRAQERLILRPMLEQLADLEEAQLLAAVRRVIDRTRQLPTIQRGYAAGNVVNLLKARSPVLPALDLSGLPVWQAHLEGAELRDSDLSGADLKGSVFSETFGDILAVAASPAGEVFATGSSIGDVHLWRTADRVLLHRFEGHLSEVWTLTFSPDGSLLLSGGEDETVRVWRLADRSCQAVLSKMGGAIFSLAFHPAGTKFAYAANNRVCGIRDLDSGSSIPLAGHAGGVYALAWSADGESIATGGDDYRVLVWNYCGSEGLVSIEKELAGHTNWVRSLAFSPDNRQLASGSYDHSIRLWDLSSWQERVLSGHKDWVRSVAYSGGGLLASAGDDGTIRVWDTGTGACERTLEGHASTVWSVAWTPTGETVLSGGNDQSIRFWDVATGERAAVIHGFVNSIRTVAFDPSGELLASGGGDHRVRLWRYPSGGLRTLSGHTDWVRSVAFSPHSLRLFSTGSDRTVRIWNTETGFCDEVLRGHESWIYQVAVPLAGSPAVTCGTDRTVRIWDWETGRHRILWHDPARQAGCYAAAITPDGKIIASGGNDFVARLWNAETFDCRDVLRGHTNTVNALAFDSSGTRLASCGDHTVRLWDARSGEFVRPLEGHANTVRSARFSPDGRYLASSSDDGTVRFWDCESGRCLWAGEGHQGIVWSVAFHPKENIIASGGNDGVIRFWDIATGDCVQKLENERPYEGTRIVGVTGLTDPQKRSLRTLGARAA